MQLKKLEKRKMKNIRMTNNRKTLLLLLYKFEEEIKILKDNSRKLKPIDLKFMEKIGQANNLIKHVKGKSVIDKAYKFQLKRKKEKQKFYSETTFKMMMKDIFRGREKKFRDNFYRTLNNLESLKLIKKTDKDFLLTSKGRKYVEENLKEKLNFLKKLKKLIKLFYFTFI